MTAINDEKTLMKNYGISREQKFVYQYKQYRYDNFQNALNFAISDQDSNQKSVEANTSEEHIDT